MGQRIILFFFIVAFFLSIDVYILNGLLILAHTGYLKSFISAIFILFSVIGYYGLYRSTKLFSHPVYPRPAILNIMAGLAFAIMVTKLTFVGVMLIQDLIRLIIYGISVIISTFNEAYELNGMPGKWAIASIVGLVLAFIPFLSMIYGITKGKYKFTVDKVTLRFKNLPEEFNGFTIAQISDVHSGTWDDVDKVARGVKLIQDQNPDMILFTGDLVNQDKDEINPFMSLFRNLTAPFGKYAVLGNHDYYGQPSNIVERKAYWDDFFAKYADMGFDLIMNDHRSIIKNGACMALVGVENWGGGRWFPKKGDLDKALNGVGEEEFCLLMSHDPTHWDEKVLPHARHIDLTLSGHTHGMQFGINVKGFRWSPIKYRYKRWIGLHEQAGQKLYINRGFGFLGFPGRVGMWPEISLITLGKDV